MKNKKLIITHESGFEEVLGHENLIRGIDRAVVDPTSTDLGHAVDAGHEHHQNRSRHGLDHDGPTPALDPVQAHDHQLPQGGLEQHHQYQTHLREYHREQ